MCLLWSLTFLRSGWRKHKVTKTKWGCSHAIFFFFLSYACLACLPGSLTFLPQARHPESGEGQSEGGGEAG